MKLNEAIKQVLIGEGTINLDLNKVEDPEIEFNGHFKDPVDAYLKSASYEGRDLTDAELDWIDANHPEFTYELASNQLRGM